MASDDENNENTQTQGGGADLSQVKVHLTFIQQGFPSMDFKVKAGVKLNTIVKRYAKENGQDVAALRLVDEAGERYDVKKTVLELGLKDQDKIEVRTEQHGGSRGL